jgi:two-component system nitrate/nitrite response regulator NarL
MSVVRVLIVADDLLSRAGLAALLAELPDIEIVGRVASSDDLAAAIDAHQPEVLLWDMGWNLENALAHLADSKLTIPIGVMVAAEEDARQAWRTGVQGLLRRDAEPARIASALAALAQGLVVIDEEYRRLLGGVSSPRPDTPWTPGEEDLLREDLTARELEVLRLMAEGLPNKTIAQRMDISEHTVKFHVNAVLGKLGAGSRTEAVVRATRLGLIFL